MTSYARVANGDVAEIWIAPAGQTPATSFHPEVASQFVEVPSGINVTQGWSYSAGVFSAPPAAPAPTLAEQAAMLLTNGLAISSASAPSLDGTYACDDTAQARANRIAGFIALNKTFPNGAATLDWLDMAGAVHTFPSLSTFQQWYTAMGNFVAACDDVLLGFSATLPSATAVID